MNVPFFLGSVPICGTKGRDKSRGTRRDTPKGVSRSPVSRMSRRNVPMNVPFLTFTIPGPPIGKQRPIAGRSFAGHTTLRTPAKTINYEALVAHAAHQAMAGRTPLLEACTVTLDICVAVPASWSKKKIAAALAGQVHPTTKPDIDNVEKAVFDGLNGVIWRDDVQVVAVTKRKRYGATPGVTVEVSEALICSDGQAQQVAAPRTGFGHCPGCEGLGFVRNGQA